MIVLTFDVEDWFHILDNKSTRTEMEWSAFESRLEQNMDRILQLLDDRKQRATFFCLGWIARKHPATIRRIHESGHEVASHSDRHQLTYEQGREAFSEDLTRSIETIQQLTGRKVRSYRAPGFSVGESSRWVFETLLRQGIEIDCSVFPASRSHGGFASYAYAEPGRIRVSGETIKEFPITPYPVMGRRLVFSGGGYFRLLPYPAIRHMTKRLEYVMTYFHPRDFDASQPIVPNLSPFRRFKSYVGLRSSLSKMKRYLDDFEFVNLVQAEEQVDWESSPLQVM